MSATARSEPAQPLRPLPESATDDGELDQPTPRRRRFTRALLLGVVPVLVGLVTALFYLNSGRHITTDNAYVKAHIASIAAEVSGTIDTVAVQENDRVEAGAELFRLHGASFRIAIARAEAALAQAESDVAADRLAYRSALAEIELHRSTAEYAGAQYARQMQLKMTKLGTEQDLDGAKHELAMAERQIEVSEQQAASLLARLQGDPDIPLTLHPRYLQARAECQQAQLDLERSIVRAPFAGMVTKRPEPGDFVAHGVPVMAVVADQDMWIEANFKETQLAHIAPGQPVEIALDSYPGKVWHGRVQSISEASGAEFALLPPQNATGNWVKIVQRIPLRITIDETAGLPQLRAGMSSSVTVDTGHVRSLRALLTAR